MLSTNILPRDFVEKKKEVTENKQVSHQQDTEEKPINISEQFKKLFGNITRYRLEEHFGENKEDKVKEIAPEASPYIADYLAEEIIAFQMIIDAAIELYQKTGATTYLAYPMKSHVGKHVFAFMESINKDKLKQQKDAFKFVDTTDIMRSNQPDTSSSSSSIEEVSAEDVYFDPIKLTKVRAKKNDVLFIVISDQNPLFNSKSLLSVLNSAKKDANFLNVNVIPTGTLQSHSIALKNKLLKKEKNDLEVYKEAYKKEKQNESRARIACYEAGYQCVTTPSTNENKETSFKSIKHHNVEDLIKKLKDRLITAGWKKEADALKLQLDSKGIVSLPELPKEALDDLEVRKNLQLIKALNQFCLQKSNANILLLTIDNLFSRKETNQAFIVPWREIVVLPEYKQQKNHVLKSLNHRYKIKDDDLDKIRAIEEQLNVLIEEIDSYYEELYQELESEGQFDLAHGVQRDERGIVTFDFNPTSITNESIKLLLIGPINKYNTQIDKLWKDRKHYVTKKLEVLAAREYFTPIRRKLEPTTKLDKVADAVQAKPTVALNQDAKQVMINVREEFKVVQGASLPTGRKNQTPQKNDLCLTLPQGSLFMTTNEKPLIQGSMFKRPQKKGSAFLLSTYKVGSVALQRKKLDKIATS